MEDLKFNNFIEIINYVNDSKDNYELIIDNDCVTLYNENTKQSKMFDIIPETQVIPLLELLVEDNTKIEKC